MDSRVKDGRLCLMYRNTFDKPQVWFQDLSWQWYFIAQTFTDYFRLMIMHLGLPRWQYAFTQVGLDPQTLQWFRFLSPERLEIDMENRKNKVSKGHHQSDKAKADYIRRKKRRIKLKSKTTNDNIIEKFSATSNSLINKTGKFARSKTKAAKK